MNQFENVPDSSLSGAIAILEALGARSGGASSIFVEFLSAFSSAFAFFLPFPFFDPFSVLSDFFDWVSSLD